jgi:hypothetical protein
LTNHSKSKEGFIEKKLNLLRGWDKLRSRNCISTGKSCAKTRNWPPQLPVQDPKSQKHKLTALSKVHQLNEPQSLPKASTKIVFYIVLKINTIEAEQLLVL